MISKSIVLANIVRSLSTNKDDFKPSYKQINRRLGEVDLTVAYEEQQRRAFEEISDDTVIAIDPGEITKPYSKALECLSKVADGSDDHRIKPAFNLLWEVAVNPKRLDRTPQPLVLELYKSESGDFASENTMIKDFISEIHARTKWRGIHVINRGGDRGILLKHYFEFGQKLINRLKDQYLIGEDGLTIPLGKRRQIERKNLEYSATIQRISDPHDRKRKAMNLRFDFERVSVSNFKKENLVHECYLVTAWSEKAKRPIELLTSVPAQNSDQALDIVIYYLSRW